METIKICALGCLHGHLPEIPTGNLLIITGDLTRNHGAEEFFDFFDWFIEQPYDKKVLIGGNHDTYLPGCFSRKDILGYGLGECLGIHEDCDFEYLENSGTEYKGLKIWGSPNSLLFDGINPRCTAFATDEEGLSMWYKDIPEDTDILITHTPPYSILDLCDHYRSCGSRALLNRVRKVAPSHHFFSHIHECGGKSEIHRFPKGDTRFHNVSVMNERYEHVNKPLYLEIEI